MKITQTIIVASALLLAAGCAHEERSMRTDQTGSPSYGYSSARTEYNTQNKDSHPDTSEAHTPQGSHSQSDNAIVAQVRETLSRDPEIAFVVPNLQITANNGAISLSGSVQSEEQKRQILSKVQSITGVVNVNNQLNIIAGANGRENSSGSQLNPTSNSGSDRLYKDAANGPDNSTNNVLNPTSNDKNGPSQLYQESGQNQNIDNMVPNSSGENAPGQNLNSNNNQQMP